VPTTAAVTLPEKMPTRMLIWGTTVQQGGASTGGLLLSKELQASRT
jgi:hypothetical protein